MTNWKNRSKIVSAGRMSNTGYHQNGKPVWWARVGTGSSARFLDLPRTRGDENLSCVVDVPPGTQVQIGAGKGTHKTHRETVTTIACRPNEQDGPEAMIEWHEHRLAEDADKDPSETLKLASAIGKLEPEVGKRYPRSEIMAERRLEIERLRGSTTIDRAALKAEADALRARLAEIDTLLAQAK